MELQQLQPILLKLENNEQLSVSDLSVISDAVKSEMDVLKDEQPAVYLQYIKSQIELLRQVRRNREAVQ